MAEVEASRMAGGVTDFYSSNLLWKLSDRLAGDVVDAEDSHLIRSDGEVQVVSSTL